MGPGCFLLDVGEGEYFPNFRGADLGCVRQLGSQVVGSGFLSQSLENRAVVLRGDIVFGEYLSHCGYTDLGVGWIGVEDDKVVVVNLVLCSLAPVGESWQNHSQLSGERVIGGKLSGIGRGRGVLHPHQLRILLPAQHLPHAHRLHVPHPLVPVVPQAPGVAGHEVHDVAAARVGGAVAVGAVEGAAVVEVAVSGGDLAGHGGEVSAGGDALLAQQPVGVVDSGVLAGITHGPEVAAGDDVHAAVVNGGVVEGDPAGAQIRRPHVIPEGVVLVPGEGRLLVVGRLVDHLVFPHAHGPGHELVRQGADDGVVDEGGEEGVAAEDVDHLHRGQLPLGPRLLHGLAHQVSGEGDAAVEDILDALLQLVDLLVGEHARAGYIPTGPVVLDLGVGEGHGDQLARFVVSRVQK